jgi:hypothetical protein
LVSYQVIIDLISATTTSTGLEVRRIVVPVRRFAGEEDALPEGRAKSCRAAAYPGSAWL